MLYVFTFISFFFCDILILRKLFDIMLDLHKKLILWFSCRCPIFLFKINYQQAIHLFI